MKEYKTLLFDIDDTLLDFKATEKASLRALFAEYGFSLTQEMEQTYKTINQRLWKGLEEGRIDRDEVYNTRFALAFKEFGMEVDGVELEKSYRNYLKQGHHLIDGAIELISNLRKTFDVYIVTNGDFETQDQRLHDSGLYPLFNDIFVSDIVGYQKPMKEFFDYVFARIPNVNKSETIIIGDSLSSDIKGGNMAGIDTCWYNPHSKFNNTGIIPTYEIDSYQKLYQLLRVNEIVLR